ncbi:alpha,alpha-phosphotrehalase [Pantoea sp. A4]|uniref:alpha,alpha-phosphotrehalase n=1 Tax=Pantoea sp. A4 TaxID=1225184 RepID=UPI0003639E7D|nr:alpha,alpha-phosphotrehalase [Pantoea sp. A4]
MQESHALAALPWWRTATVYQIYPRSFQDSTGSGIGDLAGITQRLDYLSALGVDALWITPFFASPQVDNGYDVADYYAIDPMFGTLEVFEQLVTQAHQRGLRIVLDMVFNHTSTQHEWFQRAENGEFPWVDFYIWREGSPDAPPNNWQSKFGGSAWAWSEKRQSYYLHLFAPEQADLNWENPLVRAALKSVCHYWADKGVDGLRLDVINLVSKQQDFHDDIEGGDGRSFYTDGPRIHEFLQEFNREVFTPRGLMTVGEMSSTSLERCQRYAAHTAQELSMAFNFHHLKVDYPAGNKWALAAPDYIALKQLFAQWQQGMCGIAWSALFWCNHDQPRIVSRFGDDGEHRSTAAKCWAMLLHGMQGTPFIYQGEEIGMTNPHYSRIDQYQDVESRNIHAAWLAAGQAESEILAILACKSRDNSRTPMQWESSEQAGFTTGVPWLPLADNVQQVNVQAALADDESVYYTYQRLIALRKRYAILTLGNYQDLQPQHAAVWCYQRRWQGQTLLVVGNMTAETQCFQVPVEAAEWQVLLSNYPVPPKPEAIRRLRPFETSYYYLPAKQ